MADHAEIIKSHYLRLAKADENASKKAQMAAFWQAQCIPAPNTSKEEHSSPRQKSAHAGNEPIIKQPQQNTNSASASVNSGSQDSDRANLNPAHNNIWQELLRQQRESEQRVYQLQEEARRAQEEEMRRMWEEEMRRAQEEEMRRAQEEEMRRAQEEEMRRAQEEEMRRMWEEEMRRAQEEEMRRAQEEEMRRAQEEEMRRAQEEEARRMREEERRRAQEQHRRAQENERRRAQEEAHRREENRKNGQRKEETHEEDQGRNGKRQGSTKKPSESETWRRRDLAKVQLASYNDTWTKLRTTSGKLHFALHSLKYSDMPWPIFRTDGVSLDITKVNIKEFVQHPQRTAQDFRALGATLRQELLRWHPDKFEGILSFVREEDTARVKETVNLVTQYLKELLNERQEEKMNDGRSTYWKPQ